LRATIPEIVLFSPRIHDKFGSTPGDFSFQIDNKTIIINNVGRFIEFVHFRDLTSFLIESWNMIFCGVAEDDQKAIQVCLDVAVHRPSNFHYYSMNFHQRIPK
jgi:hypothetical protein